MPFQTRKKCQNYPDPLIFFSNRKVSKLPKPSLSITYHQSFNKSNLLVKNIGFRRNLTFCCISVQIFNSLNRLKLIFVGFTRKSEKSGQYYWSSSRISSKSVKITQTPWYFSNGQKVSKLRGPVKITRTQDYANPTVQLYISGLKCCIKPIYRGITGYYEIRSDSLRTKWLSAV